MKIEHVAIGQLLPYARNSRTHSPDQVAKIARSIEAFGWMNPVLVDGENVIIAGHGRVMAAQLLGMDRVPCVRHDHLTPAQRRAYVIADNKIAEEAGWDDALLRIELSELRTSDFDLTLTGFDAPDLDALIGPADGFGASASGAGRLDSAADSGRTITCPKCAHEFRARKA